MNGFYYIGALFPIHAKGQGSSENGLCGPLQVQAQSNLEIKLNFSA